MQKRVSIFVVLLSLLACGELWAQAPDTEQLIQRGISLYNFGHCIEARAELLAVRDRLSPTTDRHFIERIDYYVALCDTELKMKDSEVVRSTTSEWVT